MKPRTHPEWGWPNPERWPACWWLTHGFEVATADYHMVAE